MFEDLRYDQSRLQYAARTWALASLIRLCAIALFGVNICWPANCTAQEEFRLSPNEFEAIKTQASLWVPYENLRPPSAPLGSTGAQQAQVSWQQLGVASDQVRSAWKSAFESDSLLKKASECLNSCEDLDWKYNELRQRLRLEYGRDEFKRLEEEASERLDTYGMPWLNLEDRDLVHLSLWWESYKRADGDLSELSYDWLTVEDPFKAHVQGEEVGDEEAIAAYREGIRQIREEYDDLQDADAKEPSEVMREYLEIGEQAQRMHELGYTYLATHLPNNGEIQRAEEAYSTALDKVMSDRPDIMEAMYATHQPLMDAKVAELQREFSELPMPQHSSYKSVLIVINLVIVAFLAATLFWFQWSRRRSDRVHRKVGSP